MAGWRATLEAQGWRVNYSHLDFPVTRATFRLTRQREQLTVTLYALPDDDKTTLRFDEPAFVPSSITVKVLTPDALSAQLKAMGWTVQALPPEQVKFGEWALFARKGGEEQLIRHAGPSFAGAVYAAEQKDGVGWHVRDHFAVVIDASKDLGGATALRDTLRTWWGAQ